MGREWSQEDLAQRAGLSRAEISAIETGRVVPSTGAALDLGAAFGCSVEEIFFRVRRRATVDAWPAPVEGGGVWHATVGDRELLYPVEKTHMGTIAHDAIRRGGEFEFNGAPGMADRTLVMAGCDPAAAILAPELARLARVRLIPLIRSSRNALDLLKNGTVHVAGIHLGGGKTKEANRRSVAAALGGDCRLLRMTRWQEGLALMPGLGIQTVHDAVNGNLRWVGREEGSGARHCLETIFASQGVPSRHFRHLATDHRGVAESIRAGWAQAGVCVRLTAEEAGLIFLSVRNEDYDLCFRADMEDDPRIIALVETLRSQSFRRLLGELPGYDTAHTGEIMCVA